jgi:hypothetical protein
VLRRRKERTPSARPTDLAALHGRWRNPVERAFAARDRFHAMVASAPAGPLRERLDELSEQVDASTLSAWEMARRAQATSDTLSQLDPADVGGRLKEARRRLAEARAAGAGADALAPLEADVALLAEQFGSLNRLLNGLDTTADGLAQLELRLEAAVARAAELTLAPAGTDDAAALDEVVAELRALRSAFAELGTSTGG